MATEAIIAVTQDGKVMATCTYEPGTELYEEAVAEWASEPGFRELIRVPLSVARRFLFEEWPGIDAALSTAESGK